MEAKQISVRYLLTLLKNANPDSLISVSIVTPVHDGDGQLEVYVDKKGNVDFRVEDVEDQEEEEEEGEDSDEG